MCRGRFRLLFVAFLVHFGSVYSSKVLENLSTLLATNKIGDRTCPLREEYLNCPAAPDCQRTCANLNGACVTDGVCVSGCFCKSGYARETEGGRCIPIRQCPGTSCPRNEIFAICDDDWECEKTCANKLTGCDATVTCVAGCQCKFGHVRDPTTMTCIRLRECRDPSTTTPKCPRNEQYKTCGSLCSEKCPGNVACTAAELADCRAGCFCDDGLVRIRGRCMDPSKCTKNCPAGEKAGCIIPCTESCDSTACVGADLTASCTKQCVCENGAKRSSTGVCIPQTNCPLVCPANEFEGCSFSCSEECDPNACVGQDTTICTRKCFCKPGFKRIEGVCVAEAMCPLICPTGEVEKCILPCFDYCYSRQCSIMPPGEVCERVCACQDGFLRDSNGVCIPEGTCPEECPPNEIEKCIIPCSEYCDSQQCVNEPSDPVCVTQCSCQDGYKRNSLDVCILETECPLECPPDEVENTIIPCTEFCDGHKCDGVDPTDPPVRQCSCPVGQKRDFISEDCTTTCTCADPNAVYGCLNDCRNDCDVTQAECDSRSTDGCVNSCYCKEGYRLVGGVCAPFSQCPCRANERYDNNGRRCQEMCQNMCGTSTEARGPGCYCSPGYARVFGVCVRRNQC